MRRTPALPAGTHIGDRLSSYSLDPILSLRRSQTMKSRSDYSEFEMVNVDFALETANAAIRWAVDTFGADLCLLSSMQDALLIDLAVKCDPGFDVVFLANAFHFPETLATRAQTEHHYGISVRTLGPDPAANLDLAAEECCDAKVAVLDQALRGNRAWFSRIRRDETGARATAELVGTDRRGLSKINPLAGWTAADAISYIELRNVPTHPLLD